MEKLIDYFIDNNPNKSADYSIKERLLVLFNISMVGLALFMIPTYLYLEVFTLLNFLYVLLVGSIIILFYFKFSSNLKIASFAFITFCLSYLFLNILYTGAINSVLVIWLVILPILAILLNNGFINYSIVLSILVVISLLIFDYIGFTFPNEMDRFGGNFIKLIIRVNFMTSIVMIVYYYDKKRQADKELLEQSNTDLEQFAYVASHDMKAPLRNIMSLAQLLKRKSKKESCAESSEYIQHILSNGHRMNELIQDVLEIATIDKQEFSKTRIDANEILKKVKENLQNELAAKNAKIEYRGLPFISVNEPQIIQVFQNLIENGLKYNRSESPLIQISFGIDKKFIHFYFSDNGIGIASEFYDKIFEMFKRLHSGFEFTGTGIGLAICKKIALRHKGDLKVEESSDNGTVFKLSLPIK